MSTQMMNQRIADYFKTQPVVKAWPPCLPGGYKLGAFNSKAQPTAIMEGFVENQTKHFVEFQEEAEQLEKFLK